MLTRLEKAQQKWGGSHSVIDKWLTERQELLVLFCRIAGFSPYEKKDHALPDQLQIQNFCQILMDYLLLAISKFTTTLPKRVKKKVLRAKSWRMPYTRAFLKPQM